MEYNIKLYIFNDRVIPWFASLNNTLDTDYYNVS